MARAKRHSPQYKIFTKLRKNISNTHKLFKLKKKKWQSFKFFAKKQLRFFSRYRYKDQSLLRVPRFPNRNNSYENKYSINFQEIMLFNLFYGGFRRKKLKKQFYKAKKNKESKDTVENILNYFERRLDALLHRARFAVSAKAARQFIEHGRVTVNGRIIKSYFYQVKDFDIVGIKKDFFSYNMVRNNIKKSNIWPITPDYVEINYNTLQIVPNFNGTNVRKNTLISHYPLKIDTVYCSVQYHK